MYKKTHQNAVHEFCSSDFVGAINSVLPDGTSRHPKKIPLDPPPSPTENNGDVQ